MYPLDQLKMDIKQKMICENCRSKYSEKNLPSRKANFVQKPHEATVKFMCESCNYKFKRKNVPEYAKVCPYCGKDTIRKEETITAAEILSEV